MRNHSTIIPLLLAGLMAGPAALAEETPKLEDPTARTSYSLGFQMGQDLKRQNVTLDREALVRGLEDGRSGAEPRMAPEDMKALLADVKRRIVANMQQQRTAESAALKEAGIQFLEQNKANPDVKVTESGLQYKVITEGTGERPGPRDKVRVHYRGTTVEGQEFDSSYKRGQPAEFALNGVIKGWGEGLQLMKEGAKYELYIPYELAYNARGPLAFQTLIFEVELLDVSPESAQAKAGDAAEQGAAK
jgi:FKBP-type peptidyl-prolyl cis-trans isomerase FklB